MIATYSHQQDLNGDRVIISISLRDSGFVEVEVHNVSKREIHTLTEGATDMAERVLNDPRTRRREITR